jgi:hypothetical protein
MRFDRRHTAKQTSCFDDQILCAFGGHKRYFFATCPICVHAKGPVPDTNAFFRRNHCSCVAEQHSVSSLRLGLRAIVSGDTNATQSVVSPTKTRMPFLYP